MHSILLPKMLITDTDLNNTNSSSIPGQMVQFGCGLCAPSQWRNFDTSPTLRLQKLPMVGKLIPSGPFGHFPENVEYGNIVNGLPISDDSVKLLYCSHVLEHLTHESSWLSGYPPRSTGRLWHCRIF
jgi:hypothetical protein